MEAFSEEIKITYSVEHDSKQVLLNCALQNIRPFQNIQNEKMMDLKIQDVCMV